MDRVSIKEKAKKMIIGNKWYLWKPLVFFELIVFACAFVVGAILAVLKLPESTMNIVGGILAAIISVIECVFTVAYANYCLSFVRGNKMEWKDVLEFAKEHYVIAILVSIVVGIIVAVGSILLVIPGIIAAIGLMFYQEVCADNPKLSTMEIVKKTWNMTNGYKMDIFVAILSFIGWSIVADFTLGILYIWLIPYMTITMTLIYEELKGKAA